jgi:hypothetical protein
MGSALPALCFREHKERGPPHCAIDRKALHVDALQISRSVELANAFGRGLPRDRQHAPVPHLFRGTKSKPSARAPAGVLYCIERNNRRESGPAVSQQWRGGRVAEGGGLLNRYTV